MNLNQRILSPLLATLLLTGAAKAQLASVQCCTQQTDLDRIGDCVSGPAALDRPAECEAGTKCVLGFGADTTFMGDLCDVEQEIPDLSRAYCGLWSHDTIEIEHQCVALPLGGITMFEVMDDEQDGDLDAADVAVFSAGYDFVPKLVQSGAELVFVECCIPDAVISEIAECLSGPGVTNPPQSCAIESQCTAGFTEPLEPGDWLYKTCAQAEGPPLPAPIHCVSWEDSEVPASFECRAAHLPGHSLFVIADTDGDVDVDLVDFAALQRGISVAE